MSESSAHATHRQTAKNAWDSFLRSRFDAETVGADLLDIEFEVLQERLPLARKQRNARTSACKIPAEVLTLIFLYAQAVWKPSRPQPKGSDGVMSPYGAGWMAVTRVCSAWRKISLSTPSLWCDLDCLDLHPQSAMEIVSRSKASPLSLTITGIAPKQNLEHWLCGPVLRRVKRLYISKRTRAEFFSWIELLFPAMPMLEDLTIDLEANWNEDPTAQRILPSGFLAGCCPPRLKKLKLFGIHCHWDSPLISPTLLILFLMSIHEGDPVLPFPKLTDMLGRLDNICSLALVNILSMRYEDDSISVPRPKELNTFNLASFRSSTASDVLAFLQRHPTWLASNITIGARFTQPEDTFVVATIPILFSPHGLEVHPHELFISHDSISMLYGESRTRREWITKLSRLHFVKASRNVGRPFHRHLDVTNVDKSRALVSKLLLFPLAPLRAIYIAPDAMPALRGEDAWIRDFSSATNVSRVAGHYAIILDLICALGVAQDGKPGTEPTFALFPRLEVLVFHAAKQANNQTVTVVAAEANRQPVQIQETSECTRNHVALLELLAVREARGKPVKEILVDKAMAEWSVWDMPAIRGTTNVSFF
ncbi:hypothetical protein PENSPDRAFT_754963 [Peniophora sp. CONT]|nr:hypothetical protein PENSPDRAFT_754963 [Peniophora sp. CONT]